MSTRNTIASTAGGLLASPLRNLAIALAFVAVVFLAATAGYVAAGWSVADATHMVTLTVFSIAHPGEDVRIEAGDNVILGVRGSRVSESAIFSTPRGKIRVGRTEF